MDKRYQDPDVSLVLNKASFLDPRFKSLAHLPVASQEETVDSVIAELTQTLHMVAQPVHSNTERESDSSPAKRRKAAWRNYSVKSFKQNRGQQGWLQSLVMNWCRQRLAVTRANQFSGYPKSLWNGRVLTHMLFLIWLQWPRNIWA